MSKWQVKILKGNIQRSSSSLSVHDHSCIPDANVIFSGSKAILRAPQHISGLKYSPSLLIRYVPLMQTTPERRKQLKEQYYFECTCDLCKDKDRVRFNLFFAQIMQWL